MRDDDRPSNHAFLDHEHAIELDAILCVTLASGMRRKKTSSSEIGAGEESEIGDVTRLLQDWSGRGDRAAFDRLVPLVLSDLRSLAAHYFQQEGQSHTLQPTALVNEAYLRLVDSDLSGFRNRHQFFALAARLIREVLVDHARERHAQKRGGRAQRVPLVSSLEMSQETDLPTVLAVHQAIERLEALDPRQSRIIELRFFGGLTLNEIASVLELSLATVERSWSVARRWLAREVAQTADSLSSPTQDRSNRVRGSRSRAPAKDS